MLIKNVCAAYLIFHISQTVLGKLVLFLQNEIEYFTFNYMVSSCLQAGFPHYLLTSQREGKNRTEKITAPE